MVAISRQEISCDIVASRTPAISGARPGLEARFSLDERECVRILRRIRWPTSPVCPFCSSTLVTRSGRHQRFFRRYRCKNCRRLFNEKTGTIFHDSRLPLAVWFSAAVLQRGMSIRQVSIALGMYYDTTHRLVAALRQTRYPELIAAALGEGGEARAEGLGSVARRVRGDGQRLS